MTSYRYEAARADGAVVAGAVEAGGAAEASALLTERGLFPLRVIQAVAQQAHPAARRDLAIVFRSIAALAAAGVPLERAVAASEALCKGPLRAALNDARQQLGEGHSFATALHAQRGLIPGIVVGMISAGERGSALSESLLEVANHLEKEADLAATVRQALAYPIVLAVAGLLSTLIIGVVVVPRFAELLADLGQDLPLATRLLLGSTDLATSYWLLLLVLSVGLSWGVVDWARRPAGRQVTHQVLLAIPVVGPMRLAFATARVARALSGMLAAGMPLLHALDAARDAAGDDVVARRLALARERVAEGARLSESLAHVQALSPTSLQLVAVGESSGQLTELLRRAGDLAAQEGERALRSAIALIEPALIVGFGAFVGFVAVALLQAVYAVRPF